MFLKGFFRVAPGLTILTLFMLVFWSPFYRLLPPDFQLFMTKLFLPVLGLVAAHWLGKFLFPNVLDWSTSDQPFIKIARVAFYVTLPLSIALGG